MFVKPLEVESWKFKVETENLVTESQKVSTQMDINENTVHVHFG